MTQIQIHDLQWGHLTGTLQNHYRMYSTSQFIQIYINLPWKETIIYLEEILDPAAPENIGRENHVLISYLFNKHDDTIIT